MSLKIGGIDKGNVDFIVNTCYPVFELETKFVDAITKTLYSPMGGLFEK